MDYLAISSAIAVQLGIRAYFVGGGPRDRVMGRETRDYDFALEGEPELFPQLFARTVGGTFFWLDEQRLQSRVVRRSGDRCMTFDFAPLRGTTIEQDLSLRDFTINALAIPLLSGEPSEIDPLGALRDIRQGLIRACSETSFDDDPLRLLRAFRFSSTLGFSIEAGTWHAIREKAELLHMVAAERIRDELFRILAVPEAGSSLAMLHEAGLLTGIFPRLSSSTEHESTLPIERFERLRRVESLMGELVSDAAPFAPDIRMHLLREVEAGVDIASLVKLAAFLGGGFSHKNVALAVERLRLGGEALRVLVVLCCQAGDAVFPGEGRVTERSKYRFFRDREPAGLAALILHTAGGFVPRDLLPGMTGFFFERYPSFRDDNLLSGDEIMELLGVVPGKAVGEAMDLLKRAERVGLVNSREEAVAYLVKNLLTKDDAVR